MVNLPRPGASRGDELRVHRSGSIVVSSDASGSATAGFVYCALPQGLSISPAEFLRFSDRGHPAQGEDSDDDIPGLVSCDATRWEELWTDFRESAYRLWVFLRHWIE